MQRANTDVSAIIDGVSKRFSLKPLELILLVLIGNVVVSLLMSVFSLGSVYSVDYKLSDIPIFIALFAIVLFVSVFTTSISTASSNFITPMSIQEGIARSLSRFSILLPLYVLLFLAITIGTILLIIPGVLLLIIFSLVMPIAVLEDEGIISSFERSVHLTKGYRTNIFVSGLLLMLVIVAATIFVGCITATLGSFGVVLSTALTAITSATYIAWGLELYERIVTASTGEDNLTSPMQILPPPPNISNPHLPPPPSQDISPSDIGPCDIEGELENPPE